MLKEKFFFFLSLSFIATCPLHSKLPLKSASTRGGERKKRWAERNSSRIPSRLHDKSTKLVVYGEHAPVIIVPLWVVPSQGSGEARTTGGGQGDIDDPGGGWSDGKVKRGGKIYRSGREGKRKTRVMR